MTFLRTFTVVLGLTAAVALQGQTQNLDIYWIDVDGGASTLIVTPSGQSMLVDTGNPGNNDRDAKRIFEVTKAAGLKQIDFLFLTHFHSDHMGGMMPLAKLIPIAHFYDHGQSIEPWAQWDDYKALTEGKRVITKPGDKIPLRGLDVTVVTANGEVIAEPINGGGPNEFCKDAENRNPDKSENGRSAGFLLSYGKFTFLDLGDLTWDVDMKLACPTNKLGTVTLFQATHHGFGTNFSPSGAPAQVWALKPRVVVVNNGARKGLDPDAYERITKIQGIEGIWQVHRALKNDAAHNTDESMTANLEDTADCKGHVIKVSVRQDGTFTVTNARNNFMRTYSAGR